MATALFFHLVQSTTKMASKWKNKVCVDSKPRISQARYCVYLPAGRRPGKEKEKREEYRVYARRHQERAFEGSILSVSKRDFAKRRRCWPPFSTLLDKNQNERVHLYMKYPRESGFKENAACWCVIMTWTLEIKRDPRPTGAVINSDPHFSRKINICIVCVCAVQSIKRLSAFDGTAKTSDTA